MVTTIRVVSHFYHHTKLLATFFSWNTIFAFLKKTNFRQTVVLQTWAFGRHFLKNEQKILPLKGKQLRVVVANDKM